MKEWLPFVFLCFSLQLTAQDIPVPSVEKNLLPLPDFKSWQSNDISLWRYSLLRYPSIEPRSSSATVRYQPISSNATPTAFFCRIEDAIARSSRVNMKFRLGSVQYVDALEGKGYFEALSYSRATNFQMTRNIKE